MALPRYPMQAVEYKALQNITPSKKPLSLGLMEQDIDLRRKGKSSFLWQAAMPQMGWVKNPNEKRAFSKREEMCQTYGWEAYALSCLDEETLEPEEGVLFQYWKWLHRLYELSFSLVPEQEETKSYLYALQQVQEYLERKEYRKGFILLKEVVKNEKLSVRFFSFLEVFTPFFAESLKERLSIPLYSKQKAQKKLLKVKVFVQGKFKGDFISELKDGMKKSEIQDLWVKESLSLKKVHFILSKKENVKINCIFEKKVMCFDF